MAGRVAAAQRLHRVARRAQQGLHRIRVGLGIAQGRHPGAGLRLGGHGGREGGIVDADHGGDSVGHGRSSGAGGLALL
jgi:hypothetical protein